ncbi:MAG TPA: hypothetical protein VG294_11200, partial [Solirubrobacteraceae bacterium]|nr:hypothetical protein [Solirubrobacteraceae bacterium]
KSALLFEGVKHQLTFTPPASTATAGQLVEFSGAVLPGFAGRVYLERQNTGQLGWHVIDSVSVAATAEPLKSASPFSIKHVFNIAGPERLRIKVPGGGGHQAVASAPFDVNVAAAPASALTPEAPSSTPHLPPEGQV